MAKPPPTKSPKKIPPRGNFLGQNQNGGILKKGEKKFYFFFLFRGLKKTPQGGLKKTQGGGNIFAQKKKQKTTFLKANLRGRKKGEKANLFKKKDFFFIGKKRNFSKFFFH